MRVKLQWIIAAGLLAGAGAAEAGNRLMEANTQVQVAGSAFSVTPSRAWNRLSFRPGPGTEIWTLDGPDLNEITFYGGIQADKPIMRETDRRNRPLPRFSSTMLLTDIPTLLENSYRAGQGLSMFTLERAEPARFGGRDGVHFTYSFTAPDEVRRRGEAYGAIAGGRLYLVTYEAPVIHYYDASIEAYRQLVSRTTIAGAR